MFILTFFYFLFLLLLFLSITTPLLLKSVERSSMSKEYPIGAIMAFGLGPFDDDNGLAGTVLLGRTLCGMPRNPNLNECVVVEEGNDARW
jgi:hypothetical protein